MANNEMGRTINDTSGLNDTRDYADFDAKDKNLVSDAYIKFNKFLGSKNNVTFGRSGGSWSNNVVEKTGLAYQTAVRYLQYLINEKQLIVKCDYGKVGRPRNKYKFVDS